MKKSNEKTEAGSHTKTKKVEITISVDLIFRIALMKNEFKKSLGNV